MPPEATPPPFSTRAALKRSSLREQVAGALRDEMMAGRLPAGTHFTVKEIAELYGVSATPVREALLDLAAQDLLWTEHNRGFTVPKLDWAEFVEIVEARTLVTDGMFRTLRGRLGAIDWNRIPSLERRADAAMRAARTGQLDVLVGCDRRFWGELAALVGNRKLTGYLDSLRVQYWIFAAPYLRGRSDLASYCWSGHPELMERLIARDSVGVHRILIDYSRDSLRQMAELCGESAADCLPGFAAGPAVAAVSAVPTDPVPADPPEPGGRPVPAQRTTS